MGSKLNLTEGGHFSNFAPTSMVCGFPYQMGFWHADVHDMLANFGDRIGLIDHLLGFYHIFLYARVTEIFWTASLKSLRMRCSLDIMPFCIWSYHAHFSILEWTLELPRMSGKPAKPTHQKL